MTESAVGGRERLDQLLREAGQVIGAGGDAKPLLTRLAGTRLPGVEGEAVGRALFDTIPSGAGRPTTAWPEVWADCRVRILDFLPALGAAVHNEFLASWTERVLERLILTHLNVGSGLTIGRTHGLRVEATQPMSAAACPPGTERLLVRITAAGRDIGDVMLPVREGRVGADVLADAVAAERRDTVLALARSRPSDTAGASALPILMYHSLSPAQDGMTGYRLHPDVFEAQLRYLQDAGYYGVTLDAWEAARQAHRPLSGRPVALTFDDGYRDFLDTAWPALKRYGFPVTLYVVPGRIGGRADWDAAFGEPLPLLGWDELRQVQRDGVTIGSHAMSHAPLPALDADRIVWEAAQSRRLLEQQLRCPITSFAYPYGAFDPLVRHLVAACGYLTAVTCVEEPARLGHHSKALPRLQVRGTEGVDEFVSKLAADEPSPGPT